MSGDVVSRVRANPKFAELAAKRSKYSWTLAILMLVIYYGFVLMVAFAGDTLTQPISSTSVIPVGMLVGVGVILASILLTGIYVVRANNHFDPMIKKIIEDSTK